MLLRVTVVLWLLEAQAIIRDEIQASLSDLGLTRHLEDSANKSQLVGRLHTVDAEGRVIRVRNKDDASDSPYASADILEVISRVRYS